MCSTCSEKKHFRMEECKGGLKGLSNGWGESNCFLNSVLQVLFAIPTFRNPVLRSRPNRNTFEYLLKNVFHEYTNTKSASIDISEIRKELALKSAETGQFDLNYPADSMEALLEILKVLHTESFSSTNSEVTNTQCKPLCSAHQSFALAIEEILTCECGETKRSYWDYCAFAHPFYVAQVFEEAKGQAELLINVQDADLHENFEYSSIAQCEGQLCRYIEKQWKSPINMCPKETSTCSYSVTSRTLRLIDCPEVYIVHLIWENSRPLLLNLLQIYSTIPYSLDLNSIYLSQHSQKYRLQSMILYGSSHYISMLNKGNNWFKIDDESINFIGSWLDVVILITRSRFYPVGLIYEKSDELEFNTIPLIKWVELEKQVLIASEFREIAKSPSGWQCQCGNFNSNSFEICESCSSLKPGVEGWVCSFCTTLNKSFCEYCISCTKPHRSGMQTRKASHMMSFNASMRKSSSQNNTPACRCCSRRLSSGFYLCFNCYLKSLTSKCQYCDSEASNNFCESCIKSNIKCECGRFFHVVDIKCLCKIKN